MTLGRTLGIGGSSTYWYNVTVKTVAEGIVALFIERSARICDSDRHARHVASIFIGARHALLHLRITFTNVGEIA